ncbi:alpha-L-rhamnosidase C-terminal domain-containing protein [Cohnella sp. GCM10020058]|uniref:alpha-L-rhamnosidase C-terminal domain-containing protein n=1 Tax=Cohnella sp. GCM10020058 TaxID=3317330 RepID=UPI003635D466
MADKAVPKWIWHEAGSDRMQVALERSFYVETALNNGKLYLAATGHVVISLDDQIIGELPEHPGNLASFTEIGLPETIAPGHHRIEWKIVCKEAMPIVDVNVHLIERRVGCIGFLEGNNVWQPTDESWTSEDLPARAVCVYGEEPYGDLENAPSWFVRGGYGDIGTSALTSCDVLEQSRLDAQIGEDGILTLKGTYVKETQLPEMQRNERHIFYHLRKQQEWTELRAFQQQAGLDEGPWIRLAMDAEYNMRFRVDNDSDRPALLLWNGAESIAELDNYVGCISESFTVDPGGSFTILPQGMRYVQFFMIGPPEEAFKLRIAFEAVGVMLEPIGQFRSDLPVADRIYQTSVHTNRICHQTGLWDGVKRDRLNWTYDFFMAAKADYVLWNDFSVLKRTIRELGDTPNGYWMNSIPAYTCWWFVNVWDYYLHTADREFVIEMKPDLIRHMGWIIENIDPASGFLKQRHQAFIEWVPMTEADAWHTLHAVLALAIKSVRQLNEAIPGLELPVPENPLPAIPASEFLNGSSLIALLLGAESGYVSEAQESAALNRIALSDPVTPLSAYWLAERLALRGKLDQGWEAVERVWGRMLKQGATTFWESITLAPADDFHHALTTYTAYDSYRISLCHSWSSTPVQWMSRHLLGIRPLAPGYSKIAFQPHAVPGMNRCQGTVSTPLGPIHVGWEKQADGTLASTIDAPEGIEIVDSTGSDRLQPVTRGDGE